MAKEISIACLSLLGGLGVFLIAMKLLSTNIETLAGNKMKLMLAKLGRSKIVGVGIGAGVTAIIQSSGAVSVMVIGFVNAGLMSLAQGATIIFGANIGTTITAQIVALGMLGSGGISMDIIFGALCGIGAFILLFVKNDTAKKIAGLVASFGMLFIGLNLMSDAMNVFTKSSALISFLATIQNPILLVLIGCLVTAILQSSSAMTGIIITMIFGGLINIDQGIYMTFGSNIGSCVVAVIACLGQSTNAKRTAFIHFFFNFVGVVIFMLIGLFMKLGGTGFGQVLNLMFPEVPTTQLAMMHTIFNVCTVLLVLPFTNLIVKMTEKLIKDKPSKNEEKIHLTYLEEHILGTPPIAVEQVKKEVIDMAGNAMANFNLAIDSIINRDLSHKKDFEKREEFINFQNREIIRYVINITKLEISDYDRAFLGTVYHTVTDIERIGDYAENILEYTEKLVEENQSFSKGAIAELGQLTDKINELYNITMSMFITSDYSDIDNAEAAEEEIDALTDQMGKNHIRRMTEGSCTMDVGSLYLSLNSNAERIGDHIINIAESVNDFKKKSKEKLPPLETA